jgi:hypothetical protein
MQKKIQVIAFIIGCGIVIFSGIRAGSRHENCRECSLALSKPHQESAKFAAAWK